MLRTGDSSGLGRTFEPFPRGEQWYPERISTLEAAQRRAKKSPRLTTGQYKGLVSAPLTCQ